MSASPPPPNSYEYLFDYCEENKLKFDLVLHRAPERDDRGKLAFADCRDARLAIEIKNSQDHKITQIRQYEGESLYQMAGRAVADLKDRGLIK